MEVWLPQAATPPSPQKEYSEERSDEDSEKHQVT